MKVNQIKQEAKEENVAILGCDVSLDKIDAYSEIEDVSVELEITNVPCEIENDLLAFAKLAAEHGKSSVRVVAEPTGALVDALFFTARRLGMDTAWVSGEAVKKTRLIENNRPSKTDPIDAQIIFILGSRGTVLEHRPLPGPYATLREWAGIYDAADQGVVAAKNTIHDHLRRLFPDFDFQSDFLFGNSGQALVSCFGANPYRIVQAGPARFANKMKKAVPKIRKKSIERLYTQACQSVTLEMQPSLAELIELRITQLFEELALHTKRKKEAKDNLERNYELLRQFDRNLPSPTKGVVSKLALARIIAETGPLSDFDKWKQLLKFAGMDLNLRQSGKYKGKTKISKRGRPLLRKILTQTVLPLVTKQGLYGKDFHEMTKQRSIPGAKAMMAIARRFFKMLFGWYKSGEEFNHDRVFMCKSQYLAAA